MTTHRPGVRLRLATAAGRLAQWASRATGRGSGLSIRGQLIMKLDPGALAKLLAGRRIAAVSGTNGKTTTTHFVHAALRAAAEVPGGAGAGAVVTNADGANLHHGLASALSAAPAATVAALETDERVVPDLIRLGRPEILILLNFSRDQLDRNHEIKRLAQDWRDALEAAGTEGPVVIANADEPLIVWASQPAHRVVWVDTESSWQADAALCPACGALLQRTDPADSPTGQGGDWACPGCELAQPAGAWQVRGDVIITPDGREVDPALQVPGRFNIANAACALAAVTEMGVDLDVALEGIRTVSAPAGRFATTSIAGTPSRLLLAKNPAGWAESLPLAGTDVVVLAINAAAADGRDTSWLWDVDYEQLKGRAVIATGPRAHDLSVRLRYAEVEHHCVPDLAQAFREAGRLHKQPDRPVDVISTYTPFQTLRKMGGLA